jgi:sugar lactone lactonase YvrE
MMPNVSKEELMRKFIQFYLILLCSLLFFIFGCGSEDVNTFDPNPSSGLRPEITSIEPDSVLGGDIVTITGTNFSLDPGKNIVAFGSKVAVPTSATQTVLDVVAPIDIGWSEPESLPVRVAVQNSSFMSNQIPIIALPWVYESSSPRGVAVDGEGNLYLNDSGDWVVYKIPTDGGEWEVYTEQGGNGDIAFDGDGNLYVCVGGDWGSEIWKVPPGGGDAELFSDNEDLSPFDLDFDETGNMYVAGRRTGLHRITPGGNIEALDVDAENTLSVRVFDGYLYWSNNWDNRIERAPITGDGVGDVEVVFNDENGEYFDSPMGIEIDFEGNIYVVSKEWGGNQYLSKIAPDGTAEVVYEILTDNNRHIAIGNESVYVASNGGGAVFKIYLGVDPAPIY